MKKEYLYSPEDRVEVERIDREIANLYKKIAELTFRKVDIQARTQIRIYQEPGDSIYDDLNRQLIIATDIPASILNGPVIGKVIDISNKEEDI